MSRKIIKQQEDRGVGTGLERKARWKSDVYHEDPQPDNGIPTESNGNSANTAAAAKATATKKITRQRKIFKEAGLPEVVWDTHINTLNCLHAAELHSAGYGFAISSNKNLGLVLCKVLTVYSKGGGTHGKHGWVEDVSIITAASQRPR
ncbi:hypothetical protein BJ912DRAFT_925968 [Pholiota molesta]|nr:hypothetical protein BJ912DRAFT_925968 [Pholiota molesta]